MTKSNTKKSSKNSKFLKSKKFGQILASLELILTLVLVGLLLFLNILPMKYIVPAVVVMLLVSAYIFVCAFSKKFRTLGKVLAIILSILCSAGIYYVGTANGVFNKIGGADTKTDVINVYVLSSDVAAKIEDAADYAFGVLGSIDKDNTSAAVADINKKCGREIITSEYTSINDLVDALYSGEVQAIVLNQAYASAIADSEGYTDFSGKTKIIYHKNIVTKVTKAENIDVTNNSFVVFISGIDTDGAVSTTSRSDVNILAVVNPDTKQIILINTPRDFYVPLSISNGVKDKLTHAGIYGVDVSMDTLGMLYDTSVNYYFRLNFTGFTDIVDSLGGVNVYSDYAFTTTHGGDNIVVGENYLSGTQALGFVRERYAFSAGDRQRGKNQMALIQAVVKKMASPAIISNFSGVMDSISGSFETSLSSSQLSSLVRMQLNDGGTWNVKQYSVTGAGDTQPCYSLSGSAYVMQPDITTVEKAKELINKVESGETISDEDVQ